MLGAYQEQIQRVFVDIFREKRSIEDEQLGRRYVKVSQ
jgi:hypothetical protein